MALKIKVKIFSEASANNTGQSVTTQMNRNSTTAAVSITNLAETRCILQYR